MNPIKMPLCRAETGIDHPMPSAVILPELAAGSRPTGRENSFEPETLAAFMARVQAAPALPVVEAPEAASLAERMARLTQQNHALLTDLFGPDAT